MPIAGKNAIHILRGANVKTNSSIATLTLSEGQPLYDTQTGYLYVGEGNTIANTVAIRAHYANTAGSATSATSASYAGCFASKRLYFNGTYANGVGYNTGFRGNVIDTIYVPTALGNTGQVWGMTSSGRAGWIDQEGASGTVANANYANVAGKVDSNLNIRVAGTNYTFNGGSLVNIRNKNLVATNTTLDRGAIPYVSTNGTTSTPANFSWLAKGSNGQVLTSTTTGIAWRTQSLPGNGYPYFVATIDDNIDYDLDVSKSSTYLLLRVVGSDGSISLEDSSSGIPIYFNGAAFVVIGVRLGSREITVAYPNGQTNFYSRPRNITRIGIMPGSGTRFSLMKLSDD